MHTAIIRTLSFCCVALLWSCGSTPPPPSLSEQYQQLAQDTAFSVYAMRNIANQAYQNKDLPLMAKALWKLCQRGVASTGVTDDCAALLDVAIIQDDEVAQARAHLAQYFITGNRDDYARAMAALPANDASYRAIFDISVDNCLNSTQPTEWLALQCYLAGKAALNEPALQKALMLFEQFEARHNMADSYFLLAKLKQQQGQPDTAADYASRAALLLSQLGEAARAEQVRTWRRNTVHAQ